MGHITFLKFDFERPAIRELDSLIRNTPFFYEQRSDGVYEFRSPKNLEERTLEPDYEISIQDTGLWTNAFGDNRICASVLGNIQAVLEKNFGRTRELL